MKLSTIRNLLGVGALFAVAGSASAITISGAGVFTQDNEIAYVDFNVAAPGTQVTIETVSFASGGFDPILSLYGPFVSNFGYPAIDISNPAGAGDVSMSLVLNDLGSYRVFITQTDNLISEDPVPPFSPTKLTANFTQQYGCTDQNPSTPGWFCDPTGSARSGNWALNVNISTAPPSVPEPETLALMAIGLAGMFFSRRRAAF